MGTIKILIADDHELYRRGVIAAFKDMGNIRITGQADNWRNLINLLKSTVPDILVTDLFLKETEGTESIGHLKNLYPEVKIMILSVLREEHHLEKAIQSGVHSYLLKNTNTQELERAVYAVHQGKQYFSDEFTPYFTRKYLSKNAHSDMSDLTKREREVLQLIADGLKTQEIADKLFLSNKTITNHRTKLMMKTDSKNTAGLLSFAYRNRLIEFEKKE